MKGLALFLLSAQLAMLAVAASVKGQQAAKNTEWWAGREKVPGASNAIRSIHSRAKSLLSPQIIGGSVATLGQFPWHGWLDIYDATGAGFLCGCSLIADKWAMSAGHCIALNTATKKYTHDVILGTVTRSSPEAGYITKTSTPYRHEKYESATAFNDISLLRFASAVTFTANIKPIALPSASLVIDTGAVATVSGFGRTSDSTQDVSDVLKYADLPIISDAFCTQNYSSLYEPANMICAKAALADQADCQGDSGGPFVLNAALSNATQIGIVSFGGDSCLGTPSVYTKVSAYVGWISTKMAQVDSGTTVKTTTVKTTTTKATTTKKPTTTKTTTTKTPTTPKPPNCASAEYKDMKKCCSPPANDLVPAIKGYKSCGGSSTSFAAFNSFGLSKIQVSKNNNSVDLSNINDTIVKIIGKDSSFVYCFLNESSVLVNGEIDDAALTTLLTQNQSASGPWVDIITQAVTTCSGVITTYNIPTNITYNKATVDISGYLMVQCVLFATIDSCPSRATTPTSCVSNYKLFDQCKGWFFAQASGAKLSAASKTQQRYSGK